MNIGKDPSKEVEKQMPTFRRDFFYLILIILATSGFFFALASGRLDIDSKEITANIEWGPWEGVVQTGIQTEEETERTKRCFLSSSTCSLFISRSPGGWECKIIREDNVERKAVQVYVTTGVMTPIPGDVFMSCFSYAATKPLY